MGKKKNKGPKGAASYAARLEQSGLTTVMDDVRKKVAKRVKRTSGKVKTAVSTTPKKARSY